MITGDIIYTRRNKGKKQLYLEVAIGEEFYYGYLKGIELDEDYFKIAEARIKAHRPDVLQHEFF